MVILGILGGLGAPEILIILPVIILLVISPIMWIQERSRRKYWQTKAEGYEKRLIEKNENLKIHE